MPRSMTAYSQIRKQTALGEFDCELRAVNHRYLDISFRLPEELRSAEPELRAQISQALERGRVDCSIRYLTANPGNLATSMNQDLAGQVMSMVEHTTQRWPALGPMRPIDLLRWPGVLQQPQIDREQLAGLLSSIMQQALDQLLAVRNREGAALAQLIHKRLDKIEIEIEATRKLMPSLREKLQLRLNDRVSELLEKVDQERIEQEIVMLLQKSDIAEEIDRLMVHCDEVRNTLKSKQAIGRRLDFLMQELNREANTLGSKAVDSRLSQAAVELKVLIEQIREQVQNLE